MELDDDSADGGTPPVDDGRTLTDSRAREELPKQRRFLVLASIALSAVYFLGLTGNTWEISGAHLEVARKDHALIALWIIWAWALLRYLQRVYELWSAIFDDVELDVYAEDERIALKAATREAWKRGREENWAGPEGTTLVKLQVTALSKPNPGSTRFVGRTKSLNFPIPYGHSPSGGRVYHNVYVRTVHEEQGRSATGSQSFRWEWSWWRTRLHSIRAVVAAGWRLPAISEHIAPLLLALLAACGPLYDFRRHEAAVPQQTDCTAYFAAG